MLKKDYMTLKAAKASRQTLPVLACYASTGKKAIVTDLEIWLEVDAKIPPGLYSSDAPLEVLEKGECRVSRYTLEDFPEIDPISDGEKHTLYPELLDMIKSATAFVSKDQTRPVLTGVWLRMVDGGLRVSATDGYVMYDRLAGYPKTEMRQPMNFTAKALKILNRYNDWTELIIGEDSYEVKRKGMTLRGKIIDGVFPRVEQLIPVYDTVDAKAVINLELLPKAGALFIKQDGCTTEEYHGKGEHMDVSYAVDTADATLGHSTDVVLMPLYGTDLGVDIELLRKMKLGKTIEIYYAKADTKKPLFVKER